MVKFAHNGKQNMPYEKNMPGSRCSPATKRNCL